MSKKEKKEKKTGEGKKGWYRYMADYKRQNYVVKTILLGRKDDPRTQNLLHKLDGAELMGDKPSDVIRKALYQYFNI